MKRPCSLPKYVLCLVSVGLFGLLLAAGGSSIVPGITPEPFVTGIVTVATGETVQLNAVNVSKERTVTVHMALYDANGAILGRSKEVLRPGQAKRLLPTTRRDGRQGIRATVHTVCDTAAVPPDPILVASTLEVVDLRTGRTSHVLTQ